MVENHVLAGVTVPLVTVMSAPGQPDASAAAPLVSAMATAGVDNLMLLGSNGEGALLSADATDDYLQEIVAAWRERRPGGRILINVSAAGTGDVLRRAERAVASKPDLLIVSPPSYFHHRDDEIVSHIRSLERFNMPYAVYNVPKYANALTAEAFRALVDQSPLLVGLKDSSGSMDTVRELLAVAAARPGIGLSQGDENALAAGLDAGAVGIVPGTANLAPSLAVALFKAAASGDRSRVDNLQAVTSRLTGLHAIRPGVPAVKAILADLGIIPDFTAPPLTQCTDAERESLRAFVNTFADYLIPTT
jgi:4-hydroxy-tetrahydrodipicolinate synthase